MEVNHTHTKKNIYIYITDFPGSSDGKESVYNAGDLGSIPGSGSSLEKEKAYIKLLSNPEIVLLVIFPKEIKTLT